MTSKLLFRKITILSLLNSPILNLISKGYLDGYDIFGFFNQRFLIELFYDRVGDIISNTAMSRK
jgi:hypothetical protein